MKLSERVIMEELTRAGFGGTQATQCAKRIMERTRRSPVEKANLVDDAVADIFRHGYLQPQDQARAVLRRLVEAIT